MEPIWVDDRLALERMGGMPDLLARISRAYAQALPGELALWQRCWEAGDATQALRVLHTLKGTAASLGALPLAHALRMQEEACKEAMQPAAEAGGEARQGASGQAQSGVLAQKQERVLALAQHLDEVAQHTLRHWGMSTERA